MVKVDPELRAKLQKQKERNKRGGLILDNRDWKKITIRILPRHGKETGVEHFSVFCEEMNKSVTCPRTWGKPDPLLDYLDATYRSGTKEQKDHAGSYVSRSEEYWMPVIVRGDEGTAKAPNVRIFRAKKSVYDQITDWMLNEDVGEDLTDPREGRDIFIQKKGEGRKTKYVCDKLDKSLLVKDKELRKALLAMAKTIDPTDHFFAFDLEAYEECYQGLTGEELPEDVKEELASLGEKAERASDDEDEEEEEEESDEDEEEEEEESDEDEEEEEEESDEDSDEDDESDEEEEEEESDDASDEDEEEEPEEVEPTVRGGKTKKGAATDKGSKDKGKGSKDKSKAKPKLPRKPVKMKKGDKKPKGKVGSKIRSNKR